MPVSSLALAGAAEPSKTAPKTLRYAFPVAETSFDPAQISDLYSRTVAAGIFDAPLEFAFMARPFTLRPNTAAALPDVSADFRSFTLRLKPGTLFADDPAFGGKPRELTAADYVYSIKRHYDPRWKSGNLYILESAKILGLSELRKRAIDAKLPFDYDTEVDGLRALDALRPGVARRGEVQLHQLLGVLEGDRRQAGGLLDVGLVEFLSLIHI